MIYTIVKDTQVGFDKLYTLSTCTQDELSFLYANIPNLRYKYIAKNEKNTAKKRANTKLSKSNSTARKRANGKN